MQSLAKVQILDLLSQGIDVRNGLVVSHDHVLNDPQVIRALHHAIRLCKSQKAGIAPQPRVGQAWSDQEDSELAARFGRGLPLSNIAVLHERSRGAINARLQKLGYIQPTH